MTIARSQLIDLNSTPYYHIVSRCVRRSFLCGTDSLTGTDFSHRREWIVNRIKNLSSIFSIKICAYAIMSNHYHLVLQVEDDVTKNWSEDEIITRWSAVFPHDAAKLKAMFSMGIATSIVQKKLETIRERLMSISWFMKCINEPLSRLSNLEDKCTGHFWEGRFKSQALLDEAALLSAMVYVDLNPIRANLAATPEESAFTSIQERIKFASKQLNKPNLGLPIKHRTSLKITDIAQVSETLTQPPSLVEFAASIKTSTGLSSNIAFALSDYFRLVDETGRLIKAGKRGSIPECLPPILERLNLSSDGWMMLVNHLEKGFSHWVGHEQLEAALDRESRGLQVKLGSQKRVLFSKAA